MCCSSLQYLYLYNGIPQPQKSLPFHWTVGIVMGLSFIKVMITLVSSNLFIIFIPVTWQNIDKNLKNVTGFVLTCAELICDVLTVRNALFINNLHYNNFVFLAATCNLEQYITLPSRHPSPPLPSSYCSASPHLPTFSSSLGTYSPPLFSLSILPHPSQLISSLLPFSSVCFHHPLCARKEIQPCY